MTEAEMRAEALRHAQCSAKPGEKPEAIIERAKQYLDFLTGKPDAQPLPAPKAKAAPKPGKKPAPAKPAPAKPAPTKRGRPKKAA